MTTPGCHACLMTTNDTHAETFEQLRHVRDEALHHAREARRLAVVRRDLMTSLIGAGVSQADIARELGVSRQAIQKMLAV